MESHATEKEELEQRHSYIYCTLIIKFLLLPSKLNFSGTQVYGSQLLAVCDSIKLST